MCIERRKVACYFVNRKFSFIDFCDLSLNSFDALISRSHFSVVFTENFYRVDYSSNCIQVIKIARYNRAAAAGNGGGRSSDVPSSRQFNGRAESVDDDGDTYFAYSSDDMLPSKLLAAGNNSESSQAASFGPSNSPQVAETTIPNFLLKLWKLVEDKRYNHCIEWDTTGFSFHVRDPYGFSKDVLPLYFKHSNLNSFIRQLNMYGFRKVTNLEKGALKQQIDQESLEFQHPYFVRGHPELLDYIKRKISNPRTSGELDIHQHAGSLRGLNHVLEELRQLREKQYSMDARLNQMKKENGAVWREVAHMRQLHIKQQQVVNKLIQFLLSLVQPATGKRLGKRQLLAIGPGLLAEQRQDSGEQPAKRLRSDSTTSTNSAVQLIESLEQELQNTGRLSFLPPPTTRPRTTDGPIIADVTDELDTYDLKEPNQPVDQLVGDLMTPSTGSGMHPANHSGTIGAMADVYGDVDAGGMASEVDAGHMDGPSAHPLSGLSFDVLSPETDSFASLSTPVVPAAASTTAKTIPPRTGQLQDQQGLHQGGVATNRPSLNRSFSNTDGTGAAATYSPDWASGAEAPNGEQSKWSKPEFSEYVDFVQTDLDSLRDFLTSSAFNVDQDSLSSLFTMADESNTLVADTPQTSSAEITGNELQVYKRPELLVNVDGTTDVIKGYDSPVSGDHSAAVGNVNIASAGEPQMAASVAPANPTRPAASSQSAKPAVWLRQQQPRPPVASNLTAPGRPIEQPATRPIITQGTAVALTSPVLVPGANVVVTQPVYVLSSGGQLQQGVVFGVPSAPSANQRADFSAPGKHTSGR